MKKRYPLTLAGLLAAAGLTCVPFSSLRFTGLAALACAACIVFFVLVRTRPLRIIGAIAVTIALALFLSAEIPVFCGSHSDKDTSADYLIAAGAGVKGTEPTTAMTERLQAVLQWLNENPDGTVIVSGSKGDCGEYISEAQAMENWLLEQGISSERIILEEQAGSTRENILYSLVIIEQRGGDPAGRVAFASSDYHLYRIRLLARQSGCDPVCIAGHTARPFVYLNYAIREACALWYMRLLA